MEDDHFILDEDPNDEDLFSSEMSELEKMIGRPIEDTSHMAPPFRKPMFVEPNDIKINVGDQEILSVDVKGSVENIYINNTFFTKLIFETKPKLMKRIFMKIFGIEWSVK